MTNCNKILLVLTSHDRLGDTGKPTGAYLSEVAHPYDVFVAAGLDVRFASPKGGRPPLDGTDDADPQSRAFLASPAVRSALDTSLPTADARAEDYDAIFFAGGHGTMWDFPNDPAIARLASAVFTQGGVVGAVCHGPAALLNVTLPDGSHLLAGREVAGFTNEEENAVGLESVVPFSLQDTLVARGALHRPAPKFTSQVVTSGRLVTGQNPASATATAQAVVAALAARGG